mmetsp:Transcript_20484/g.47773  ORF Transcript_20484/g.47773 Transcript_20484/m.47773 type:complete len:207 (-) Transcript_20484:639-1259(-)
MAATTHRPRKWDGACPSTTTRSVKPSNSKLQDTCRSLPTLLGSPGKSQGMTLRPSSRLQLTPVSRSRNSMPMRKSFRSRASTQTGGRINRITPQQRCRRNGTGPRASIWLTPWQMQASILLRPNILAIRRLTTTVSTLTTLVTAKQISIRQWSMAVSRPWTMLACPTDLRLASKRMGRSSTRANSSRRLADGEQRQRLAVRRSLWK